MANYSETITYGGVTINATKISAVKRQKQRKMVVGKRLVLIDIIGVNVEQWELDINAVVTGTSLTDLYDNRAAIEALNDLATHALADGLHDGNYYMVPESLSFDDTGERGNMSFIVNFRLIEA